MEEVLIKIPLVFIYKQIPPNIQKREEYLHQANEWDTQNPDWDGKLEILKHGSSCSLQFTYGKKSPVKELRGKPFGHAVVRAFPGKDLEPVVDSSRYFTLKIWETKEPEAKLMGMGFTLQEESAKVTKALENYFRREALPNMMKRKILEIKAENTDESQEEEPKNPSNGSKGLEGNNNLPALQPGRKRFKNRPNPEKNIAAIAFEPESGINIEIPPIKIERDLDDWIND